MLEQKLVEAFWLVIIFSGIPLSAAAAIGLFAALVQTATQIQEQSIAFTLKALVIGLLLLLSGGYLLDEAAGYVQTSLAGLARLGRM